MNSATHAHPDERRLLQYLDGELGTRESASIKSHLEGCWTCRLRAEQLQSTILAFTDFCGSVLDPLSDPPPHNWARFKGKLQALADDSSRPSTWSAFAAATRRLFAGRWLVPATGLVVTAVMVAALVLFLGRNTPLSAMGLLRQSNAAEKALFSNPGRIVHRVMTLERRNHATGEVVATQRVETWQATGKVQKARRVFAGGGQLVAAEWVKLDGSRVVYREKKLSSAEPNMTESQLSPNRIWELSPSADDFARLTGNADNLNVEETDTVYVLRYANGHMAARPRLLNASLTLRRSDLHAIQQTFETEENGQVNDYRISENAMEQYGATELSATVFNVDAELMPVPVAEKNLPEPLYVAGTAELQVDAMERLDKEEALLRDQIKVQRNPGGPLVIEGIVSTPERKTEVIRALGYLAHNPAVKIDISTAAEAESRQSSTSASRLQVQSIDVAVAESPGSPELWQYLASTKGLKDDALRQEVQRFSLEVLGHLTDAQMHALTLKEIASAFSVNELDSMNADARAQWRAMALKHAGETQRHLRLLLDQLEPVFGPFQGEMSAGGDAVSDLSKSAEQLCTLTASGDVLWQALSSSGARPGAFKNMQVWQPLREAAALAGAITTQLGR